MAYSKDYPNAPCLAGTHSVAGVPFTIPVLVDISFFLCTLAQLCFNPYAAQNSLKDFQFPTIGKLSIIQFNTRFIAISFCVTASKEIFMDYYQKALSPTNFQRALTRPEWEPCTTVRELMDVVVVAARREEAIVASHQQHSHPIIPLSGSLPTPGVVVPSDSTAMDVSVVHSRPPNLKKPPTQFPFAFYRELCQA